MATGAEGSPYPHSMQWAATQGIRMNGVAPTEIPGRGLGMVATRVIEENEVLVSVPSPLMLTIDCVPKAFVELFPAGTSIHGILAAFLSHGDVSSLEKWKIWRNTWPDPQSLQDCMPISWIKTLQSSSYMGHKAPGTGYHLLPPAASGSWNTMPGDLTVHNPGGIYQNILLKQEKRMRSAWECILQAFPDANWDTFVYHWFIINTRSFYYVTPGRGEPEDWNDAVGLVPIADYFNHADDPACIALFDKRGYTINATRRIEEGEEVYISYGSHPNDYLFVEYGFFLDHNSCDAIFLDDLVFKELTESELEVLKFRDLYGDYRITHNGACSRTQAVACMRFMSSQKWEDYVFHRSIDGTDREIMTDTINGWVETYLKECISTIRSLETMRVSPLVIGTDGQSISVDMKLSALLKRWNQIRYLCEATLHGTNRPIRGNTS